MTTPFDARSELDNFGPIPPCRMGDVVRLDETFALGRFIVCVGDGGLCPGFASEVKSDIDQGDAITNAHEELDDWCESLEAGIARSGKVTKVLRKTWNT